jgi:hypothetical protein
MGSIIDHIAVREHYRQQPSGIYDIVTGERLWQPDDESSEEAYVEALDRLTPLENSAALVREGVVRVAEVNNGHVVRIGEPDEII